MNFGVCFEHSLLYLLVTLAITEQGLVPDLFINAPQDINKKAVRPDRTDRSGNGMDVRSVISNNHDLAFDPARRNRAC